MEIKPSIIGTLEDLGSKIESELGGLLDCQLDIALSQISLVSKAEFFSNTRKKMVMTRMVATGDKEGPLYVFCQLKDAVKLGGILIMLPPAELEKRIKQEDFGEEEADAFGEIANILSGDLNSAFEDLYPEKLHFKKTGLEVVVPTKVKPDDSEPFPPGRYVCANYAVHLDGQELEGLIFLFPAEVLGMEPLEAEMPVQEDSFVPAENPPSAGEADSASMIRPAVAQESAEGTVAEGPTAEVKTVVLVVVDGKGSADLLAEVLRKNGWQAMLLGGKENFKEILQDCQGEVKGVFLVMENIEDQSIATAIKVRSAFGKSVPLIAAGAKWTRTKVLQAVKYGVRDILVLPATAEEILEKTAKHFAES
jgi:chemotaxis protein CheY-P-specific phosphatase CheC